MNYARADTTDLYTHFQKTRAGGGRDDRHLHLICTTCVREYTSLAEARLLSERRSCFVRQNQQDSPIYTAMLYKTLLCTHHLTLIAYTTYTYSTHNV